MRLRALFVALLTFALVMASGAGVIAQVFGGGNAQILCQDNPRPGLGNATPCPAWGPYASPVPNSTSAVVNDSNNIMATRNEELLVPDANYTTKLFLFYATGATLNPRVITYDRITGASSSAGGAGSAVPLPTGAACSTVLHAMGGGGDLGYGYVFYSYCATDTSQKCLNSATPMSSGSSYDCNFAVVGNQLGGGVANQDLTATASVHTIPGQHLSEVNCSEWGPYGTFTTPVFVCGGQNYGPNTSWSMSGGYGAWTFYPTFNSSGVLTNLYMDTACSVGGATVQFDILTGTNNPSNGCNGLEQPTTGMRTNAALVYNISADTAGSATVTTNLPNWSGSCGATSYTWGGPATGTVATDIASIVSGFNGSAIHTNGCYTAHPCAGSNCPIPGSCLNGSCIVITCDPGCVPSDNTSGTTSGTATGTITINYTGSLQTRTAAGNSGYFHYGLGPFFWPSQSGPAWRYDLISNSNSYSYQSGAYAGNNGNLSYAVVACPTINFDGTTNPTNGVWKCYDYTRGADGFVFTFGPGSGSYTDSTNRYLPMGATPACSPTDCSSPPPYYQTNNGPVKYCYLCLVNMPAARQPTGWVPFVFNGDLANMPVGPNGMPAQSGDIGEYVAPSGDLYLAWNCMDTSATTANAFTLCWQEWPVGGASGTNIAGSLGPIGGFIDRNFSNNASDAFGSINLYVNEAATSMWVLVATGAGSVMHHGLLPCPATSGTCVSIYKTTTLGATTAGKSSASWSVVPPTLPFTPSGTNQASQTCQNAQDEMTIHNFLLCTTGGGNAAGTSPLWFLDIPFP